LVALANIIRLSLKKGAHAVVSGAAWQEIRVRSGSPAGRGRRADKSVGRLATIPRTDDGLVSGRLYEFQN
jgi:hypothetical protein